MNKIQTYEYLKSKNIEFEITEHDAVYNMEELSKIPLPYPDSVAKNLFVRDDKKTHYYLISVKEDIRVNLKEFRKEHGLRNLSFASEEDLKSILNLTPGSVTPLGLISDDELKVEFYLDKGFLCDGCIIGCHPNDNTATVWINTNDLIDILNEHGNKVNIVEF